MTEGQARALRVFRKRADEGRPRPTYQQLADEAGLSGTGAAHYAVRALKRDGHLPLRAKRPTIELATHARGLAKWARDEGHNAIADKIERWLQGDEE